MERASLQGMGGTSLTYSRWEVARCAFRADGIEVPKAW